MIKLILVKGSTGYDISELVQKVVWSGKKTSPARSIKVTLMDDDGYGHTRSGIDVEQGNQCILYWKDKKIFQGMFMRQDYSRKLMNVTAYDNGIYLANNKDSFHYENKTASAIFADCCKRFGIPYGSVADTQYKIPDLPKSKTTLYDVIADALSITYKTTGIRFYPICVGDEMRLVKRSANVLQWVLETGVNMEDYSFSKSIEKVKTRIKLLSDEGTVMAEAVDKTLESKIGAFQDVDKADDTLNSAQLQQQAQTTLKESKTPERNLSIQTLGIPEVITGTGVYVIVKDLNISRTYYVDEDTHTFEGNYHWMDLKLAYATDIEKVTIVS